MKCKEFEKCIPFFLTDAMDYDTMANFREHLNTCESCKEELSIQFLVNEGIRHLENGDAFDMEEELQERLRNNQKKLLRHGRLLNVRQGIITFGLFIVGVIGILIWG